jgi:hypothetical protein
MIGDGDCGEIGGMKIGRGNLNIWRKPAPYSNCYKFGMRLQILE